MSASVSVGFVDADTGAGRLGGGLGVPTRGVVRVRFNIEARIDKWRVRRLLVCHRVGEQGGPPYQRLAFVVNRVRGSGRKELLEWPAALQGLIDHRHQGRPHATVLKLVGPVSADQLGQPFNP